MDPIAENGNFLSVITAAADGRFLDEDSSDVGSRRDSYDSGLAMSPPESSGSTPKTTATATTTTTRRRKKKKRLGESLSVSHFHDVYRLTGETLGEGSYGQVRTCVHLLTRVEYAVKIISKSCWHFHRSKMLKEIELYYLCQGQKEIIQLVEYFEEENEFYLVFEKAKGGPLLTQIQRRIHFTESEAAAVVRDLAAALAFLHSKGVAHRDLKPDNVLCSGEHEGDLLPVKLCDFDLCSACHQTISTPTLQSPVGSVEYMAPEVVEAFAYDLDFFMMDDVDDDFDNDDDLDLTYDKKCDLWSLGVIAYILLCGYLPFSGRCGRDCGWEDRGEECADCQGRLFHSITSGELVFPDEHWSGVSEEARDLIRKLLVRDASKRLDAASVLRHPWIVGGGRRRPSKTPALPLQTPQVLRRRESVHEMSDLYADALAIQRNCDDDATMCGMKRSVTSALLQDWKKTSAASPVPQPQRGGDLAQQMRRQTSLVLFPEDLGNRWEF